VRLFGRCGRGERLVGYVPQGHWKTITLVAALRQLQLNAEIVVAKMHESSLRTVDYFVWNMWLALSKGTKIGLGKYFLNAVCEVARREPAEQASLLGLIGTLVLAEIGIPQQLTAMVNSAATEQAISNCVRNPSTRLIRVIASLKAINFESAVFEVPNYIDALSKVEFQVDIPKQLNARQKVIAELAPIGV
jgi:hypothetical protein